MVFIDNKFRAIALNRVFMATISLNLRNKKINLGIF